MTTAKRYYAHKHLIKEDKVHDKICHRFMNITETVEHMNMYYQKYTALKEENEQLKKENNKLHQKIFEMRTNIALERTEISRQTYTWKKNEKEYLTAKEFLDEIEKW